VLLEVALHGMEKAAGVRYRSTSLIRVDSPAVIRYPEYLVTLGHSGQDALEIKARLAAWLAPRGSASIEDKTGGVTLSEDFDFLGFNARRFRGSEGAGDHCEMGNRSPLNQRVFDWLDAVL
jgi:RNA-directed DNA polymerase